MLFNSLKFLLIFPLIFGLYWTIPVINNSANKQFVGVTDYFQDYTHLNNNGAVTYTQYIIPQVSDLLNIVN